MITNFSIGGLRSRSTGLVAALAATVLVASCGSSASTSGSSSFGSGGGSSFLAGDSDVFHVFGPEGGPFPEGRREYWIRNTNKNKALRWSVSATIPWLDFSEKGGLLGAGQTTTVLAEIDHDVAESLAPGDYPADIIFRDARKGGGELYLSFLLTVTEDGTGGSELLVTPKEPFLASGEAGGDIYPSSKIYTLENDGDEAMNWRADSTEPWIEFATVSSGQLLPFERVDVEVVFGSSAQDLPVGEHVGSVEFRNLDYGVGDTERLVELTLDEGTGNGEGRVEDGLQVLYEFEEGNGDVVRDVSGLYPPLDLTIENTNATTWRLGSLDFVGPSRAITTGAAERLSQSLMLTNEVTLEAWITADNLAQDGPARIMTLSSGAYLRNMTLGQGLWGDQPADTYNLRLRSTATDNDGMPMLTTAAGSAQSGLAHVVYTRDATGTASIYVGGKLAAEGTVGGDLSNWDPNYLLAIGNEVGAERPWLGELHLAAVYDQALTPAEVKQNFDAGTGDAEVGHILVTPNSTFYTTAEEGSGPLVDSTTYTVENPGPISVQWEASTNASWIYFPGSQGGILESNEQEDVQVNIDGNAVAGFSPGLYEAQIEFRNLTNGVGDTDRLVQLVVTGEDDDSNQEWVTEVTQHGITWHFGSSVLSGRFVNGDYWVVGPVTVTNVSPSPTGTRNGSMLNPRPKDLGPNSAFDDRVPYDDMSLQVDFPVSLKGGDSLLSTISQKENPYPLADVTGKTLTNYSWLRTAGVLTVVTSPQPATAFRPPYTYSPSDYPGGIRPIFEYNNIRWDKLPGGVTATSGALAFYPDSSLTPLEQYALYFERPWVLCTRDWVGRQTHPSDNMPNYHREVYNVIGDASLLLLTDATPIEKQDLMTGFLQVGIDMMGAGLYGGADSSMHKWPTIFAGLMLDSQWMVGGSNHSYRTDYMTYYPHEKLGDAESEIVPADEGWTGAKVLWRQDPVANPITEHENLHPTEWQTKNTSSGGGKKREAYRRSNSYTWPGAALAARMMDASDEWGHPQFLEYVDRWMTEYDVDNMAYLENLFSYKLYIGGKAAGSEFVKNMWKQYRSKY